MSWLNERFYIAIVILFAAIAWTSSVEESSYCPDSLELHTDNNKKGATPDNNEEWLTCIAQPLCIAPETAKSQGGTTLHKSIQRTHNSSTSGTTNATIIRAATSATRADRYGLSNHKILFAVHARQYYVNGLHRLII